MLRLHKLWFNMLVFETINENENYELRLGARNAKHKIAESIIPFCMR